MGLDGSLAETVVLHRVGSFTRADNHDGTELFAWDDGTLPEGTASAALFSRDGLPLTYTRRIPIGPLPYCQMCTWYPVATSTPVGAMLLWTSAGTGQSLPSIATLTLTRDGRALQPPVDLGLRGFRLHAIVYTQGDVLAATSGNEGTGGLDLVVLDPLSGRARGDAQHVAIDGQIVSVNIVATEAGAVVVFGVLTPTSRDLHSLGVQCRRL